MLELRVAWPMECLVCGPFPCDKRFMQEMGEVLRALAFAARKHRLQRRKDIEASPYINHPIDLANILVNDAGVADPVVVIAAILHDTVEDTDTTLEELSSIFGADVSGIVAEVTDDKALPKGERKRLQEVRAPRSSFRAQQVKLADKIANLRDLSRSPPVTWDTERQRAYFDWAKRVVDGLRQGHPRLVALFDVAHQARP